MGTVSPRRLLKGASLLKIFSGQVRRVFLCTWVLCLWQSSLSFSAILFVNFDQSELQIATGAAISPLPLGSTLFVVAPTGTEQALYSAIAQASNSSQMANFLSNTNNLQYFNAAPVNYGANNGGVPEEGSFLGWLEAPDSVYTPGAALIATTNNTATNKPLFLLLSSSTNGVFDSNTSFLLLRQRLAPNGVDRGVPVDSVPTPFLADVSRDAESGMDVIFGEVFGANTFRLSLAAGYGQITSPLAQTNVVESTPTYQILANNGADRFFATTNTSGMVLTETNLPTGFSIATNTGVITAGTNAAANTYSIRLVASNSLTASVATNTLIWTLQASSLSFTTTTDPISAVAGVAISPFTFVSTGTSPTYTANGNLRGLTLSTNGILSGIPNSVGTNDVSITSSAGGQNGNTTFSLAVAAPTISVPAGELTGGQIVHTAGTARMVTLSKSAGFTDLTGEVSPTTSGVTFNGTDLVIAADAAPQLAVSADPVLTLTASRRVDGTTISASTTVALKIVAPIPTWQIATNSFEVVLGENFSLQLQTDQSNFLNLMQIGMLDPLPDDLSVTTAGLIRGKIATTITSDRFETRFVADTGLYKGGGQYTSPPITFLPRNTPPVIRSSNRVMAGVKLHRVNYSLSTSNNTHVDSEILGPLPPGITSRKGGNGGKDIVLEGFPTAPGIYTNTLVAKNYLRPGSTSNLQETSMELVFHIFDKKTPITQSLNSSSLTTLRRGVPIDTNTPLRLTADVLATGTYVIANSKSFRPNSFDPADPRYEFLPGILLDPTTGILSGTPTASGTFLVNVSFMNARKIEKQTVTLRVQ